MRQDLRKYFRMLDFRQGKEEERARNGGENRTPMDNGIEEDGRVLVKVGSFRLEENVEGSERDTEVYDCIRLAMFGLCPKSLPTLDRMDEQHVSLMPDNTSMHDTLTFISRVQPY